MKDYTEKELKQIFENRSNCYADSDEVIMAMDKDRFIEVLKELKILPIQRVSNSVCYAFDWCKIKTKKGDCRKNCKHYAAKQTDC